MEDFYDEESYKKLLEEYQGLKAQYEALQKGIQQAYLDPETREPLKKIMKKYGGVELDDPEYEKAIKQHISKLEEKLNSIEEKERQRELKKQEERIKMLLNEYGITDEEVPQVAEYIKKTGITPTTEQGWREVLRSYQRTKVAVPTQVRPNVPFNKGAMPEDYLKNPEQALFKEHLKALGLS